MSPTCDCDEADGASGARKWEGDEGGEGVEATRCEEEDEEMRGGGDGGNGVDEEGIASEVSFGGSQLDVDGWAVRERSSLARLKLSS